MHGSRMVVAGLLVPVLCPAAARADIIGVGGSAMLIPRPADAQLGVLTSNTTAFAWNEAQGVTLAAPMTIDAAAPGMYGSALSFVFDTIGAGSVVSSHFIHFDTVGGSFQTVEGSVTFDADILGVIAWNRQEARHLDESDAAFGLGTIFSTEVARRGVFDVGDGTQGGEDWFTISPDQRTLAFHLQVSTPFDEIRVLTVPEPAGLAALSLLGFAAFRRRRPAATNVSADR
ncbi:MAG: PEP-CTERM sorting domain-containing protein [Planctomycetia bacterium]|nr:MAG: PEP-CTERM sorting domain-containing protein [Planctomycetia bacterium]